MKRLSKLLYCPGLRKLARKCSDKLTRLSGEALQNVRVNNIVSE